MRTMKDVIYTDYKEQLHMCFKRNKKACWFIRIVKRQLHLKKDEHKNLIFTIKHGITIDTSYVDYISFIDGDGYFGIQDGTIDICDLDDTTKPSLKLYTITINGKSFDATYHNNKLIVCNPSDMYESLSTITNKDCNSYYKTQHVAEKVLTDFSINHFNIYNLIHNHEYDQI